MSYINYAIGIIIRPLKTIRNLREDSNRFIIGLFSVLTLGALYSATAFLLNARDIPAQAPFVRLPTESHYFYQGFFTLPVSLASWFFMGSTIHLTIPGPEPRYKDVLALIGLPYDILVLPLMWLPETIIVIGFPSIWNVGWWILLTAIRVALGTIWVYIVCVIAIKELYKLSWACSLLHTLTGLIMGVGIAAIFIR